MKKVIWHQGPCRFPYNGGYLPGQGRMLENNGIIPTAPTDLSRDVLRNGRDAQLEKAVEVAKTLVRLIWPRNGDTLISRTAKRFSPVPLMWSTTEARLHPALARRGANLLRESLEAVRQAAAAILGGVAP